MVSNDMLDGVGPFVSFVRSFVRSFVLVGALVRFRSFVSLRFSCSFLLTDPRHIWWEKKHLSCELCPTCYFINNGKYLAIGLFFYSIAIKTLFKQHLNSVLFYLTIVTKKETKCLVIICVYFNYWFSLFPNFFEKRYYIFLTTFCYWKLSQKTCP